MKAIILAAGYAKRLYPLTLNQPKPLLHIGGKPTIEYVVNNLALIRGLDHIYVVVNDKFTHKFHEWLEGFGPPGHGPGISIITNKSDGLPARGGAIASLHAALTHADIDDDVVVVAADNLFGQSLESFGAFARQKNAPVVAVYDISDADGGVEYSSVEVDQTGRVLVFTEKPKQPTNTTIGVALYYYPKAALPLIHQYINEGNDLEHIGLLVQWMHRLVTFYAWHVPGPWFDIGSKEALEAADRIVPELFKNKAWGR